MSNQPVEISSIIKTPKRRNKLPKKIEKYLPRDGNEFTRAILESFQKMPPYLQNIVIEWSQPQNWSKSLLTICKQKKLNYDSVKTAIIQFGTAEFYAILSELVKRSLDSVYPKVIDALVKKAVKGDMKAIELFLRIRRDLAPEETSNVNVTNIRNMFIQIKKEIDNIGIEEPGTTDK